MSYIIFFLGNLKNILYIFIIGALNLTENISQDNRVEGMKGKKPSTKNISTSIPHSLYKELSAMVKHFGYASVSELFREATREKATNLRRDYREERAFRQEYPKESLIALSELEDRVDGIEEGIKFIQQPKPYGKSVLESVKEQSDRELKDMIDPEDDPLDSEEEEDWDD
jgi:Arc/MetJ-type ribon-helix-helix transcriptional regulator